MFPYGVPHKFLNAPAPISGGLQNLKFDASNFPAITFMNNTGQEVCDMRISNIKPPSAKISKDMLMILKFIKYRAGQQVLHRYMYFFHVLQKVELLKFQ